MTESQNKRLRNRRLLSWNSRDPAFVGYRTLDQEAVAGLNSQDIARDAARSPKTLMTRWVHLVVFAALIALSSSPACAAASGSVTGQVRDSAGVPQIGAEVQLLRSDLTVVASVYTDSVGHYVISSVFPGRYAVKAMGAWFLPALRENVRVRTSTVVNLTLNTLYEAMQWLPAEPRSGSAQQDDWAWTLRSAANRPLLRWLEDGPLVVVSDETGAHPRLKARLVASGQEGTFGESGERITAVIEDTPSDSRELLARVDFAPGTDAGMESMLGFRQDLGFAGSVQSVAAVAIHPEITSGSGEGLDEVAVSGRETIHLGDEFEAIVGSNQVVAWISSRASDTVAKALPFASASWLDGNSSIRYRMTTFLPANFYSGDAEAHSFLPAISARVGNLSIEHGMHQELGWERQTDLSGVSLMVFADRIENPVLEAAGHFGAGNTTSSWVLLDPVSGLLHVAGPHSSTAAGVAASFQHRVPGGNLLRAGYANGDALVFTGNTASMQSASLAQLLASASPRRTQTYALSLSGTLEGTGTRWRASYRWQPEDTTTPVAPFMMNAAQPYLNFRLNQPIRLSRNGAGSFNAMINVSNLLAQGYRPFLLSDGSLLIFAQEQRGIQAGLAFNF